ncbi:class I SAM-dependent DNA methyltransferase [Methylocapsa acidiphila]|uniref:class I SAM-dependent DNA methyltransferase n=1 Tax=Methylocapsa acidiphila TaxID=133552 RepID=UPI000425F94A|nr:methyltransferase [Methylocapsa acidiphila]
MSPDHGSARRGSGDIVVDRRFLYAEAAASENDHAAAAEILEQTLELAPNWAPLWFALACAYEKTGRRDQAAVGFSRAAELDVEGELGAALHLARLGVAAPPAAAPIGYVRGLFDQYADRFDAHLVEKLGYRGPDLLAAALARLGATQFGHVVDLGCGTGLCGARFRSASLRLSGVDLSPRMIHAARERGVYDRLEIGALDDFLAREPAGGASLVLAADVLVYIGDLAPVSAAAARVLEPQGYFAFTLQRAPEGAYGIGADLRYSHSEAYVRRVASAAGLSIAFLEQNSTRKDVGADVPGLVVVAARA